MTPWIAAFTTFTASALEFVEAATIVMAVGYTAGWRTALTATAWAIAALAVITAVLGRALVLFVPIAVLQVVIGIFLLLFGFSWLRKAIWRYAGRKKLRDESAEFDKGVSLLRDHRETRYAFVTAFNGVLLEGLEVAIIVVTFATERTGALVWAASGAAAAGLLVLAAAVILRHPFSRIPETAMGFIVGVMLLSFGTFWSGEGLGLPWWQGEATLLEIVACYFTASVLLIVALRDRRASA